MSVTSKLGWMICAAMAISCGDGVLPEQRDVVWFTAVETETPKPEPLVDPGPGMDPAQISSYEPIVNGFLRNHEELLGRPDISSQIERIENVFLAVGRYHEILAVFRDDVEARGTSSHVADRLAWGYIRLGQRKKARDLIDQMLADKPDRTMAHFLDGAYWLQEEPRGVDALQAAARAWRQVLVLDSNFRGPEGIDANVLQAEVQKFEQQIEAAGPAAAPEPTSAELARAEMEKLVEKAPPAPPEQPASPEQPDSPEAGSPEQASPEEAAPQPEADTAATPDAPPPADQKRSNEDEYRLLVAKGQIALSGGKPAEAERLFRAARMLKPDGFAAEFGRLQAGWSAVEARNEVAEGMRKLAERKDLTPRQKYDLGVFLYTKMSRGDLASPLLGDVLKEDPDLATRLDVQGLLDRIK